MVSDQYTIYGLRLSGENQYRYVGLTSVNPNYRFTQHIRSAYKVGAPQAVYCWMRKYGRDSIVMEILEECPSDWDYLQYAERYWIMSLKDFGHNLLNHTDGGGGTRGMALSENHKELIKLGVSRHFAENGQKSVYEYWVDHYGVVEADRRWNALKEKKSIAMSGEGNHMYGKTGQSAPCYGRVGVKHPMFGTHHSDEARARISASTTGRPKSEITKIRMSYANHIRHHSVKVKSTCKWCLGADLQIEIKKRELELNGEKVE